MQDNPNNPESLKAPEKRQVQPEQQTSPQERAVDFSSEKFREIEQNNITEGLMREIEMMELDEQLKNEAQEKAKKIEFLGQKEKIDYLFKIAQEKGIVLAVRAAKETNDPYLLDVFRDTLAKNGFYKDFIK